MRYLGLDCSTRSSGWAIFDDEKLIAYGVIKSKKEDWRERVFDMADEIVKVIKKYNPDRAFCEDVPLKSGANTVLKMLSFLQGCVCGACVGVGVYIELIPVSSWRSKVGLFDGTSKGKERAEMKRKSIEMANELFGLELKFVGKSSTKNEDDAADSILIAYSQIHDFEEKPKKTIGRKVKL